MGQNLSVRSCRNYSSAADELNLLRQLRSGDATAVDAAFFDYPELLLHFAASEGRLDLLSLILDQSVHPDVINRHKQTPVMLSAMHGRIDCLRKLIESGANILMFDSLHGRTCLHYAAYYGHSDCLQAILEAAHSTSVADSWGFARFVNVRDNKGRTPLHLAAQQGSPDCAHILLDNGALVCATTGGFGFPGSTPLHMAARRGSIECVRELLAWGADRLQTDSSGKLPYTIALKRKHEACAAILNPSAAEPLLWPSTLKLMCELDHEAKHLLEVALAEANMERERNILKETAISLPSPLHSKDGIDDDDNVSEISENELCCICFEQVCTIQIQECGHQMCAHCTLALCCHNKPTHAASLPSAPICPFCRSNISKLMLAKSNTVQEEEKNATPRQRKSRMSQNLSEGSSSFKGLTAAVGSLGMMGLFGSGRKADSNIADKL